MLFDHASLPEILACLEQAVTARFTLFEPHHETAFRLFNGFYEGGPDLVVDIYATTAVIYLYSDPNSPGLEYIQALLLSRLPWLKTILVKTRSAAEIQRTGRVTFGGPPDWWIQEGGVRYHLDLTLNQDASLYLDTRFLRRWLIDHADGWRVLNTFAYTGSLGIAALAGGAKRVVQVDRSQRFLSVARQSAQMNHFAEQKQTLLAVDFFKAVAQLKRSGSLFDCVIVDPPFFSSTDFGSVDLVDESRRVINKIRPLVKDGGWLVTINNALFASGANYLQVLQELCADGYMALHTTIPIPPDFTGYPETIRSAPPTDPAPFNHPTKIAVLTVHRKKGAE